jgi:hypothetical protein
MKFIPSFFVCAAILMMFTVPFRAAAAQSASRLEWARPAVWHSPAAEPSYTAHALIYHIKTGLLELGHRLYMAGSGNREGHNNPAYERIANRGPVPEGQWGILHVPHRFFGQEVWLLSGTETMGRNSILIHPDSIHLHGRPTGESKGCIVVKASEYQQFRDDMHRLQPTRIIIDRS